MRCIQAMLVFVLVSLPVTAQAEFRTVTATEIVSIAPEGEGASARILVKWQLPVDLADKQIDAAGVKIKLASSGTGDLPVEMHRVMRTWSASTVGWSTGWSTPGGDFVGTSESPGLITERNEGIVRLDVSNAVKDQIAGRASNFGFVIVPREGADRTINAISANDVVTLSLAELVIAYREKRH